MSQVSEQALYVTPATKLLEKRKEMMEIDGALAAQKEEFQTKMISLQQRREELEIKEQKLAESLMKFDRFLKENDARRKRALKKTAEEKEVIKQKDKDISTLTVELQALRKQISVYERWIAKQEIFEKFLRSVLQHSNDYTEISELMDRHATLSSANKELVERERSNQLQMDNLRVNMAQYKEETRVQMLNYTNQLALLRVKLEKSQTDSIFWEKQLSQVQSTASKRTLLLGRIKMATANLYTLVQKRLHISSDNSADTIQQLDKIEVFIQDLHDMTLEYERSLIEEAAAAAAAAAAAVAAAAEAGNA